MSSVLALVVALAAMVEGALPMSVAPAHAEASAQVVLDGKGFGHGVGMAQDGAYALGVAGKTTAEILTTFYPGTTMGTGGGSVSVSLDTPRPAIDVVLPGGGRILDAESGPQSPGFPVAVAPGGSVRLSSDGGLFHAFPLSGATPAPTTPPPTVAPATVAPATTVPGRATATTAPPPPTDPPPAPAPTEPTSTRALWAVPAGGTLVTVAGTGNQYRGVIEASGANGGLQLVNHLDVEQYLRGMGEVREPSWPAAALQTQAIAARTYALRSAGGVLCSTDRCQVYLGATAEYSAMDAAVAATRGQVVRYDGGLADTVYSANGGGFSATPEEGFGGSESESPYLRAAPYPTLDPEPWAVRSTLAEMAGHFGYRGTATGARVSHAGPSGRVLEVTFEGDHGPLAVDGQRVESVLKLRSTLFTLRIEQPPPPAEAARPAATPRTGGEQLHVAAPPGVEAAAIRRPRSFNRRPWIAVALLVLVGSVSAASRLHAAVDGTGRGGLRTRKTFPAWPGALAWRRSDRRRPPGASRPAAPRRPWSRRAGP